MPVEQLRGEAMADQLRPRTAPTIGERDVSAKPWANPIAPLDKRLRAAELAIANVDTGEQRRAIMHELVEGEREEVNELARRARTEFDLGHDAAVSATLDELIELTRLAPAG